MLERSASTDERRQRRHHGSPPTISVPVKLAECVSSPRSQLSWASLINDAFRYACADLKLPADRQGVLFDENGALEELLPDRPKRRNSFT